MCIRKIYVKLIYTININRQKVQCIYNALNSIKDIKKKGSQKMNQRHKIMFNLKLNLEFILVQYVYLEKNLFSIVLLFVMYLKKN